MDYLIQKSLRLKLILENTKKQEKAIQDDDMDRLEKLVEEREELMAKVDELDNKTGDMSFEFTPDQVATNKEILEQIISLDNSNKSLMTEELEHIKSELKKIRIGKQQGENYGNEYGVYKEEGIFFDTKE